MRNCNNIFKLCRQFIVTVAVVFLFYHVFLAIFKKEIVEKTLADAVFDCLESKFADGNSFDAAYTWIFLAEVVEKCSEPANKTIVAEEFFGDEEKFFIPGPTQDFEYNLLTLGVGHNIDAEKKILKKYTNVKKYVGVDPTSDINENLVVEAGGTFLQRTVGAKDEEAEAYLMNHDGMTSKWVNVTYTSLQKIIDEAGMSKHVDFMLMDIEGAEFEILGDFIDHPEKHTPICQLNVEIHSPWDNGVHKDDVVHTLFKLAQKREYLLYIVKAVVYKKQVFNRCFFLNVKHPYCVEKYYSALNTKLT